MKNAGGTIDCMWQALTLDYETIVVVLTSGNGN